MNTPALLLFDLGGVLIENATFERMNSLLPQPLDGVSFKERWLCSSAVRRFELGEISPDDFAERFIAEWGIQLTPDEFLQEFVSWPKGYYPEARETIRILRQRYRVACLSNTNILHWEKFGGFENVFDITFFSHLLGVIKPDYLAFERVLSACSVEASEVCFFDDSLPNVQVAQGMGMRAFHVEGIKSLQHVLRTQGWLPITGKIDE